MQGNASNRLRNPLWLIIAGVVLVAVMAVVFFTLASHRLTHEYHALPDNGQANTAPNATNPVEH